MSAFERSAGALPDVASLYAWEGWTPDGPIEGDRVVIEDLDGDGRDDLAVHFSQGQSTEPDGNWGKTVTTPTPNRLVVYLAQPDGSFVDATAELFGTPEPVVLPGFARKVDVGDLNGDGRPDWVYALNREDGRATDDVELIEATSAVVLSQPGNGYRVVTFGEPSWHHAARIYVSGGVGHVLAVGLDLMGKPMIGDWDDAIIGMHEAFVLDETGSQFVAAGAVPADPATFVVLPPDQPGGIASQVVTVVIDVSTGSRDPINSHPALLERDATGQWTIADYRDVIDAVRVPFVAWNGARGTTGLATIDGMPLMIPNYPESALLRPTPGEDPVAVMWLQGQALPQPREDGYYYENDGRAYARFEFYRAVDGEFLDADLRITGERRFPGQSIFDFEVLDVNADGLEDIVAYPVTATARPDVYLNLGNREFMRLDDAVLPAGPLWGGPGFRAGNARFLDANGDGVQDLLYFPYAVLAQYYDGSSWEVHLGTTNRLADFDTRAIEIADRRAGTLIATWGGDDILSDTNAAATDSRLDGGAGLDTATYSGAAGQYGIGSADDGEWRVVRPGDVTDTLANVERIRFSDMTLNLTVQDAAARLPAAELNRLMELYVAFFNRLPDADGLEYWVGEHQRGMTIDEMAELFYGAGIQYSDLTGYRPEMTNAEFVNVVYRNVLGRADGADPEGLAYWAGELAAGRETRGSLVSTILDSAHTFKGHPTWGWVPDLLDNKIAVANIFAVERGLNYNTPEDSIANGMAIAAAITPTDTSAAIALIGVEIEQIDLVG